MTQAATEQQNQESKSAPPARRVNYQPTQPVGSAANLKGMLEAQKDSLKAALPKHVTPDRIIKTLLVAVNRTPELLQCTQSSVFECINRSAELGLDISGTLGEAYAVPFNNKGTKQATFIPGYRGLVKLARQSGDVKRVEADVVCEHDEFDFRKGANFRLDFAPNIRGDRGKPIGAYALVEFKDGGFQADFMPVADIEKIRGIANSKNSPAWRDHWGEMAKKTVLKRTLKLCPLSADKDYMLQKALEHDNQADFDFDNILSAQNTPPSPGRHKMSEGPEPREPAQEEPQQPPEEETQQTDDGAPSEVDQLIDALAAKADVTNVKAEQALRSFAGRMLGDLDSLDASGIGALRNHISNGDIDVAKELGKQTK